MILGLLDNDNDDDNFFPFKTIDHFFFAFDNDKDNVFWWMNDDGNDIDDFGGSRRWVWLKIKKTSFRSRNKTATTITMIMMIMWVPWISIQKKNQNFQDLKIEDFLYLVWTISLWWKCILWHITTCSSIMITTSIATTAITSTVFITTATIKSFLEN